jgi:glutamate-ammonia-ligase adenylyltransferase
LRNCQFYSLLFLLIILFRHNIILTPEGLLDLNPDIVDYYVFLREVETRLRLIKGSSSSKISKSDLQTERIIDTFNMNFEEFFKVKLRKPLEHL